MDTSAALIPDMRLTLAQLAADIYSDGSTWDILLDGFSTLGCHAGLKDLGPADVAIVFRGSADKLDFVLDLAAKPISHPLLGTIHAGFYLGVPEVWSIFEAALLQRAQKRLWLAGHSLGGSRALLLGGLLAAAGTPPAGIVALAPAKPGYQALAVVLDKVKIDGFHNRLDPVPDLPETGAWVQPRTLAHLNVVPPSGKFWLIDDHAVDLYVKGVAAIVKADAPKP